ncbi:sugar ABC transporter ATP-binding protein [Labrys okinawensis]|uniref:sugar ABC transporter ATP-binding protein n=1 Tax=Labrys okinawensis TaxID=346911 RepID=UPI0039BD37F5
MYIVALNDVSKSFGPIAAVTDVSLSVGKGERIGLLGHNGAGKSTLLHLIAGNLRPTAGSITAAGLPPAAGRRTAIRCVHQELSLCPNLSVAENMRIMFPCLRGAAWRRPARAAIAQSLDRVFQEHGIDPDASVGSLPIGKRQQVEIARAFAVVEEEPTLVILDEPTSALDRNASQRLFAHLERFAAGGGSVILVTHKMDEVFRATDRIVVMRDGRKVADGCTSDYSFDRLVSTMGHVAAAQVDRRYQPQKLQAAAVRAETHDAAGAPFRVHAGEIVGLAGLAGHGQSELIKSVLTQYGSGRARYGQKPRAALVAGDRRNDGLFTRWSILQNISLCSLGRLQTTLGLDLCAERDLARHWCDLLQVKCGSVNDPVMSLSGGGQQKTLFARALASGADLILMDDPMRGVDISTKRDVYRLIQEEATKGRAFVWYTTEFDELLECDRVYVMRNHLISGEVLAATITEERVVALSFAQ